MNKGVSWFYIYSFVVTVWISSVACQFDTAKLKTILDWNYYRGVYINDKVEFVEVPGWTYGAQSAGHIEIGEKIASIPYGAMVGHKGCEFESVLQEAHFTATQQAALHLIYEKYKSGSTWKPYINILLPKTLETPLFWNYDELETFQKSKIREEAVYRREATEHQYKKIVEPLFYRHPEYFNPIELPLKEYKWAMNIIWGRGVHSHKDNEVLLIPIAELFNPRTDATLESATTNVQAVWTSDGLEFWVTGKINPGDPIYNPLSTAKRMSNGMLLLDYGFTLPGNKNNQVVFENPIDAGDSFYKKKKELLEDHKLWRNTYTVYHGDYDEIFSIMRIQQLIPIEFEIAYRAFAGDKVISPRNEKAALRNLLVWVNRMLEEYETTLQDDRSLQYEVGLSNQMRNAIIVRKGEKEVLTDMKQTIEKLRKIS